MVHRDGRGGLPRQPAARDLPDKPDARRLAAIAATALVWIKADDTSIGGAYVGFAAAIVVWGWHEMSFLMGAVAGPNHAECPPNAVGWRRFTAATATVNPSRAGDRGDRHPAVRGDVGAAHQAAPLTFLLLFVLRLSAKFNCSSACPTSATRSSRRISPTSRAISANAAATRSSRLDPVRSGIAAWAWIAAEWAPDGSGASASATLLAGLAALGVIEHLFLVLPLRDAKMWRWASATSTRAAHAAITD